MRIAYLHQYFNTPDQAGSTRSYEIARRLAELGHEVHIITTWREKAAQRGWRTESREGITIHWLSVRYSNHMGYAARIVAFVLFAVMAARRVANLSPDMIYATSTPLTIAIPALYCKAVKDIPFVFEVRDLWPEIPIRLGALKNPVLIGLARWLEKTAYRQSAHIVALSPDMRQGVLNVSQRVEVSVVPNFCSYKPWPSDLQGNVGLHLPFSFKDDRSVVLYAGTLGHVNNLSYLVEIAAAARNRYPRLLFVIVGDGREAALVRRLAEAKYVLNHNLLMRPPMKKADMPALFSTAAITTSFVRPEPALAANSANKFFDSISLGKPIAINHEGWLAEIIRESGAGVVLPESDPQRAADMLAQCTENREGLRAMGAAAQRLAETRFRVEDLVGKIDHILRATYARHHQT